MSAENVELIRPLQPRPDIDLIELVTDDDAARVWREAAESLFDPSVQIVFHFPGMPPVTYPELDGLRAAWRDWLARWTSYRVEIEDLIDAGDRVLVLHSDYARPSPGAPEIVHRGGAVWTVREGRVTHVEFYFRRSEALASVGAAN